ncbi:hypothetical protein [Nostoc commune]|nr:hypothetical protein [Nostoc commune]
MNSIYPKQNKDITRQNQAMTSVRMAVANPQASELFFNHNFH